MASKYAKKQPDPGTLRLQMLHDRWEAWKLENKSASEFYMEYWPTDRETYFCFFPNKKYGHEVADKVDAVVANQWQPRNLYYHLITKYAEEFDAA